MTKTAYNALNISPRQQLVYNTPLQVYDSSTLYDSNASYDNSLTTYSQPLTAVQSSSFVNIPILKVTTLNSPAHLYDSSVDTYDSANIFYDNSISGELTSIQIQ